jgi:hypothetical protein
VPFVDKTCLAITGNHFALYQAHPPSLLLSSNDG